MKRLLFVLCCNVLWARPAQDLTQLKNGTYMETARLEQFMNMLNNLPLNAYCEFEDAVREDRQVKPEWRSSFHMNYWADENGYVNPDLKAVLLHMAPRLRLQDHTQWPTPAEAQLRDVETD